MKKDVLFEFKDRSYSLFLWRLAWTVVLTGLLGLVARADRSLRQQDPAFMYEKAGEYANAALYWHRAMRGVSEVWIPFMWGDVSNAPGKFKKEYANLVPEYRDRLKKCLRLGNVDRARLSHIEFINEIWMNELVEQEDGGFRASSGMRAKEAEKRGDFLLAEVLRRGQARFFRMVAIPYHEQAAETCEKRGQRNEAMLHRQAAKDYEHRAVEAEMLAKGDKVLADIPGFGGKSPWVGIKLGHTISTAFRDAYYRRVLSAKGEPQISITAEQVSVMLKKQGLRHAEEPVRFAAVSVLANLGERVAVLAALNDCSALVRQAAARALVTTRWAEGWAACYNHSDLQVCTLIAALLKPGGRDVRSQTYVVTELIRGLGSTSAKTRSFSQRALERITGRKLEGTEWSDWWKKLGNAQPGLVCIGPGVPPKADQQIDFGAWWQSGFGSTEQRPNPLLKYSLPATIEWCGHLVVSRTGEYRFYVRNRGESIRSGRRVRTAGRYSFPAYFPAALVRLEIDGEMILPGKDAEVVEDPSAWMRLDFTKPLRLNTGLHGIRLEFTIQSYDDFASVGKASIWGGTPCVRLYWSSEHFLRELVPADHLVTIN